MFLREILSMLLTLYLFNIVFCFISEIGERDHDICFILSYCLVAAAFGKIDSEKDKPESAFFIFFPTF